jgi:molecular chaperone Hsp33
MSAADHVVRAITKDGSFRVIAAITTQTAQGAATAQRLDGAQALRLAELITCAVIVWRDASGATLIADALPDGTNRGIINPGGGEPTVLGGDHVLQVNYTLPNGAMHQGIVGIAAGTDLATALMQYMQESESTLSIVALTALPGPAGARVVGGYLIQLLPEATHETIGALTEHVGNLAPLATHLDGGSARGQDLIARVLEGFPYDELADSVLSFGCTCSEGRVLQSLLTLDDDEVASMIAGDALEVRCDACGTTYQIEPSSLRAMRDLRDRGARPS